MKEVLKQIEEYGFKAYVVGGYVRDSLLKRKTMDIDICTNARPKDLINIFSLEFKKDEYGVVTIIHKNIKYEITTFRKEITYSNRKPVEIQYIDSLEEDLKRRDFTINAMCFDSSGNLIDLFNGKKDLNSKKIVSIGDVNTKLREDPLRILRAVRFATILNFKLDDKLHESIIKNKGLLKEISYDRKKDELNKIFASKNVGIGIKLLTDLNLIDELEISNINNIKITKDTLGVWSQLDVVDIYNFTKLEKDTIRNINKIVSNKTIGKIELYKYGLYVSSIAADILGINKKVIVKASNSLPIGSRSDINITTDEIIKLLNKEPGKWLNELYSDLEDLIINLKLKNTEDSIKEYIIKNY